MGTEPDTVILTVSPLIYQTYTLTTNDVQDTAPSANTIWLNSQLTFAAVMQPDPSPKWLANVSTRVDVGQGDDVVIGGFIAQGTANKRVMIRAIGPSLTDQGVSGALADPVVDLYDASGNLIATNDNWADNANQQEIIDTGIAPTSANESVILMQLPATTDGAAYTAVMSGANNTTGVGLLEVYDLDAGIGPDLLNISTRGLVETKDKVMIGGVIVHGTQPQTVIARALGPSLDVTNTLADPTLELHDQNGALIASNDNWRSDQESEIEATNLAPTNDNEAAILATLTPEPYTAVVQGANGTTGVALAEIYALNQ
jgi:hypothetical protein